MRKVALVLFLFSLPAAASECKLGNDFSGRPVSEGGVVRWGGNDNFSIVTKVFGTEVESPLVTDSTVGRDKYARSKCQYEAHDVETFNRIPMSHLGAFSCPEDVAPATRVIVIEYDYSLDEGVYKETNDGNNVSGFRFSGCFHSGS